MRQLQLVAKGEPSDVIKLTTVSESALGQEDVLVSMEAAPINPSDFLFVRGLYGVRPAFPSPVGAEGVGRVAKMDRKSMSPCKVSESSLFRLTSRAPGQTRLSLRCATSFRWATKQIPCNSR